MKPTARQPRQRPTRTASQDRTEIARLLGLRPTRGQLAEIGEWLLRPDFPARNEDGGWHEDTVRAWHAKLLETYNASDADALKDLRNASLKKLYAEGKPLNKDQKAELRELGIAVGDEAAERGGPSPTGSAGKDEILERSCNSQHHLASCLQAYYAGRLNLIVDDQFVSGLLNGRRLPQGVPPPPAKTGNYFAVREWVAWFDRWLLPKYALTHDASGVALPDLARQAQESKYRTQIIEHKEAVRRLELLDAKYTETQFMHQLCLGLGQWVSTEHARVEDVLPEFSEHMRAIAAPVEMASALRQWLENRLRRFTDDYLSAAKKELQRMEREAQANAAQLAEQQ